MFAETAAAAAAAAGFAVGKGGADGEVELNPVLNGEAARTGVGEEDYAWRAHPGGGWNECLLVPWPLQKRPMRLKWRK